MEKEENTVDFQDETQEEETFEVDETEEESEDESSDNDENSTQNQEDKLETLERELAKYKRLANKNSKKEEKKESPSDNSVTKEDLERIRLEAKGYEEDDIDLIMKFGGTKALEDESIREVINIRKEKRQQVNAQAKSTTQGKSSRRYSQEQLRNMPLEKLEKLIREGKIK